MNNREVMQQALEAIRIFREWETGQDYESCRATVLARALAAEESLGAALAEPQDEPVAWMYPDDYERMVASETWANVFSVQVGSPTQGKTTVPLYTHPAPQRQTLTEKEIEAVFAQKRGDTTEQHLIGCARAIERAHGIGGKE